MGRRTLERRCERAGVVPPEVLIACGRVIAASIRLDSSLTPVEAIALEMGFASHSALCGLFQGHAGMSPTVARTEGAVRVLERVVTTELRRQSPRLSVDE
jgi:transcriptional regulator GlxA family with amidase domain